MDLTELTEYVREMFDGDGEAETLGGLQFAMLDGAEKEVTQQDLRFACECLVTEGMLEATGPDSYACTKQYLIDQENEFREGVAEIFAEHVIKKAAGK